jgi:hydroxymethylpyrimidine pyrophosphatase-like HAD family hydrolase
MIRFRVLACDYDGTLASGGQILPDTRAALGRLRATGRSVVMVTGRHVDDLVAVCPDLSPFDLVVAENGGVLFWPKTRRRRVLAEPPPAAFVERLRAHGTPDVSVGEVVVAMRHPHEAQAIEAIEELGLELQVIFNKGAVMVLPSGVNKATGLAAALNAIGQSRHEVVGVGDAENDHALLGMCECAVAVGNGLPMLKARADLVTRGECGEGVIELIDRIVATDLADLAPGLERHSLLLGHDVGTGAPVNLPAHGTNLLLAGASGGGKSTIVMAILEQANDRGYQYCVVDPEGDYDNVGVGVLGNPESVPTDTEVANLLEAPGRSAVVNLSGLTLEARPRHFAGMMLRLLALRARASRPHLIVIDEAHHLVPRSEPAAEASQHMSWSDVTGIVAVTVDPGRLPSSMLVCMDSVMAVGEAAWETLAAVSRASGEVSAPSPPSGEQPLQSGEALLWQRRSSGRVLRVRTVAPAGERRRHQRKYAQGDLGPERSFTFRGPDGRLRLKAQNLTVFLQLAEGVDDDTWRHHLEAGDYSRWIREDIKDTALAEEIAAIEGRAEASADATRRAVREAITNRYTGSA